jgi:hypothetical protein
MNMEELLKIIRECFNEEISAEISDFCGDPYAEIRGKKVFFYELEKKLKSLVEDKYLTNLLDEDAERAHLKKCG